jgi:TonB family protein
MSRLQKKCIIASAAVHSLLVLILLFGAALMPEAKPKETATLIHVFDPSAVSMVLASHGGSPLAQAAPQTAAATPPAPQPPMAQPPQPRAAPAPVSPPEIPKPAPTKSFLKRLFEPAEPPAPAEPDDEPAPKPKKEPHKVVIDPESLKPVKHKAKKVPPTEPTDAQAQAEERAQARADARAAQRRAEAFGQVTSTLSHSLSSQTPVEMSGPGGGGPAVANYRDIVATKYTDAWAPPADLDADVATVSVTVTIARDGSVMSARITRPSGNKVMDNSIQNTLDNVTFISPFPEGVGDAQRTFTIKFNLQAKRNSA